MSNTMEQIQMQFEQLYNDFNSRDIDAVISFMTDDVKWANGMEGGHVNGKAEVKKYWLNQFAQINPRVVPEEVQAASEVITIKVHQIVHDLNNQLLADFIVHHEFHLKNGKIAVFNIVEH